MFDIKKTYEVDEAKATEGAWEDIGNDAKLLIARTGNKKYQERFRKIPRTVRQQITSGMLDDTSTDDILCRMLSDTILLGWTGIAEGGKELAYSKDEAYRMLKTYPDFRELVWNIANDFTRFRAQDDNETVKNSKASSSGS